MRRTSKLCALLLLACTSSGGEGTGSNTNWLECERSSDCPRGALCVDRVCEELASEPCGEGISLTLESSAAELHARYGTHFADALYVPVSYGERPSGWTEPAIPALITARVTDASGEAVAGCEVRLITHANSGWVFASGTRTDDSGTISARWLAGDGERQTLTAALLADSGRAASAELIGSALPHDAPPLGEGGALLVRPTLPYLSATLTAGADALRVRLRPLAAPHHAFFVASYLPDFFMGLQNTSDSDAFATSVAAEHRSFIASVWNRSEGAAEALWSASNVSCGPHEQDLGGIRCELRSAWQPGDTKELLVEFRTLAAGEAAPEEYAGLGYESTPCASTSGCTDYSVFIAEAGAEPQRLCALRIASGRAISGLSSYIDAYGSSETQTSCLSTPLYQADYTFAERVDGAFVTIRSATYGADYQSWNNQVCAIHGAVTAGEALRLWTGGPDVLSEPALPGDERVVTLDDP